MRLVFLKSKLPLSVAIRWLLGEDCSHFALVFDTPAGGLLFESNLLGTHPKFYKTELASTTLVHEVPLPLSVGDEDAVWDAVVARFDGRGYDWGAFFYFAWRAVLKKLLGLPLPMKNPWAKPGTELCVEVFQAVKKYTTLKNVPLDLSMTSPHELYGYLSGTRQLPAGVMG